MYQNDERESSYAKNGGALCRRFLVIQDLRQRGRHLPSHWRGLPGLTISTSPSALRCYHASRAHLVLAMIDEAGILLMSIPTEGILLYFRQCR